ncbi:amino acid permease [Spirochaeta cellobiosiphila]|uniref:amino acid permease n=1 Tax=Spirochaeta cellobiosiphila TaxID=504483 RepID=UPI00041AE5FD|nr:amino acid permease [Spirochaeta cellobiosiphila]
MKRTLGFVSIFCISSGAMISSGLFVLPGLAYVNAGSAVFISYLIAGLIALTTVLSLSELITAMPMVGGDYFYVSRSLGPLFGTVSGLLSWLALSLKSAFAIIGISELVYLAFAIDLRVTALVLTLLFSIINLFGVKEAVRFQIALVIMLIVILLSFFVKGVPQVDLSFYRPFMEKGFNSLISTAGFVFVSFGGILTTASIAGEVIHPKRNVPLGLISATVIVTLLYGTIIFVVVGTVPSQELSGSLSPIALAAQKMGGQVLFYLVALASLLAFITTANGGILTASRYPVALAQDGMFPQLVTKLTKRGKSPFVAIILTGFLIGISVLLDLTLLIKAASTVILLSNIFAHLSVIIMRESNVSNYRPSYRSPFYPWLQILGIMVFIFLIADMGIVPVLISLLFVFVGVFIYFLRRGSLEHSSPALIHLVERITNKDLVTEGLGSELRKIIEDRDGIILNELDEVIDTSAFWEVDGHVQIEDIWFSIATTIHDKLLPDLSPEYIVSLLKEREEESSTAISSFVAIPHMIFEGKNTLKVLMIRAREGIYFDEFHNNVKAVFVLLGTKDCRNLHLRSLAAIAQVMQHARFEGQWLKAKGHEDLKDILILNQNRHRYT